MKRLLKDSRVFAILVAFSMSHAAMAEESEADLAQRAQDPTQPLTAFAVKYNIVSDFHNLSGADMQQITMQPVIPWKWGDATHIARLTLGYTLSGPSWPIAVPKLPPGVVPPDYTPTQDKNGLGDLSAVDVMVWGTSWGRQGLGLGAIIPTASDPSLGTEKWSIGPAYVAITKIGDVQAGFLAQWLFSVAGESDRDDVNSVTIQPFASYGLGNGWSIGTSYMGFSYNAEQSKWASVPLGLKLEKLIKLGNIPARFSVEYEYNFADSGVAPKNIFRFTLVPLF